MLKCGFRCWWAPAALTWHFLLEDKHGHVSQCSLVKHNSIQGARQLALTEHMEDRKTPSNQVCCCLWKTVLRTQDLPPARKRLFPGKGPFSSEMWWVFCSRSNAANTPAVTSGTKTCRLDQLASLFTLVKDETPTTKSPPLSPGWIPSVPKHLHNKLD